MLAIIVGIILFIIGSLLGYRLGYEVGRMELDLVGRPIKKGEK